MILVTSFGGSVHGIYALLPIGKRAYTAHVATCAVYGSLHYSNNRCLHLLLVIYWLGHQAMRCKHACTLLVWFAYSHCAALSHSVQSLPYLVILHCMHLLDAVLTHLCQNFMLYLLRVVHNIRAIYSVYCGAVRNLAVGTTVFDIPFCFKHY